MMEDFRRPDHPDFMDSSELAKAKWSGIRHNSISNYVEVWLAGEKKGEISFQEYEYNPQKFQNMYADIFGLKNVEQIPLKGN